MATRRRSAEEWLAELNRIINAYRTADGRALPIRSRDQVVRSLMELGLTEGEALRYMGGQSRPAVVPPRR